MNKKSETRKEYRVPTGELDRGMEEGVAHLRRFDERELGTSDSKREILRTSSDPFAQKAFQSRTRSVLHFKMAARLPANGKLSDDEFSQIVRKRPVRQIAISSQPDEIR
jgi:hypothetical protein